MQVALWYSLRNNFWDNDADTGESQFGLLRTDFSAKPAYAAFRSYTAPVTETLTALDVGAFHQAFGVHVGVEELVAVWFERADRFDGCEGQRGFPAVNDDVPAAAVHRADDVVASYANECQR